jgi:hypothetical protein
VIAERFAIRRDAVRLEDRPGPQPDGSAVSWKAPRLARLACDDFPGLMTAQQAWRAGAPIVSEVKVGQHRHLTSRPAFLPVSPGSVRTKNGSPLLP